MMNCRSHNGLWLREGIRRVTVFLAACLAVFVIPWWIPVPTVALGESYALGFNNRAAVIGLGVVIASASLVWGFGAKKGTLLANAARWFRPPAEVPVRVTEREAGIEIAVLCIACLAITQLVLWWDSQLAIPYWGEADYFLSRIDLVALGYRPYVDFSFLYGPATLYIPYWLDCLSFGTLGLERAYAWTVAGSYVVGFVCNYVLLRGMALPDGWRAVVLALCCIMWMPLTMGLQYTPLRFMAVPCALTVLYYVNSRDVSTLKGKAFLAATAAAGTAVAFFLSPEMGIVCVVTMLAFSVCLCGQQKYRSAALIAAATAAVLASVPVMFPGYFYGVSAFSAGAMNFPIYPNMHNLLLVMVALYVIGSLAAAALSHIRDVRAPFLLAMVAANTLLLSPSLGRCDPGHVGLNSSTLFMTMFAASATKGRQWFVAWLCTFAFAFVLLNQVSYWSHYLGTFKQALAISDFYRTRPQQVLEWQTAWEKRLQDPTLPAMPNWRRTAPFPGWAANDIMSGGVALPVGGDIGIDRFVKTQAGYRPPFHLPPKPDLHLPADVERAVHDAQWAGVVILPEYAFVMAQEGRPIDRARYEEQIAGFLSGLMIFPVYCRMKHTPFLPEVEVCKRLARDARVLGAGDGYAVLRRDAP